MEAKKQASIIASMPRYAAIDIGSNSVRMEAAEVVPGSPMRTLAADREVTRLGSSVFRAGRISDEAIESVCAVLRRMVESYRKLDVVGVRAVATSAVRDASNQEEFVARASEAIGTPVEIISGTEEARLIHLGVQARWPHPEGRVFIVDVGGGSAEFIVSVNGEMKEGVSRPLGAVRLTEVFLRDDPPTPLQLRRLIKFIDDKFDPVRKSLKDQSFDRVICTSASAAAIVGAVNQVPRVRRDDADQLSAKTGDVRKLFETLSRSGVNERKKIGGIGPRRAEIITAGAAVFTRVLETLKLPAMHYSIAGVRDGIIADLAARGVGFERSRLTKSQVKQVEHMCNKYSVDLKSARHVANFALDMFESLHPAHGLPPHTGTLLETAGLLHNVGHFISTTSHHKHSAYIVTNSDMPGYTDRERQLVSLLCRYHRKSLPTPRHESFRSLPPEEKKAVQMLTPILRIAVGLDASREQRVSRIALQLVNGQAQLSVQGPDDLDLEVWAVERAADAFRQVYGIPLVVSRSKS